MIRSISHQPEWLYWLDSCPSTNSWAIEHLAQLQHGDVIFTQHQTAGRGQHGRIWHSPPGVLTASFVLEQIPTLQLPKLSSAAGLAVIYAIEDLIPDWQKVLKLKWPNDILLEGRKLAGILCEASASKMMGRIVVGIGLNRCVNFDSSGLDATAIGQAISLHQVSPTVPDEFLLLERLRHYLLQTAGLLRLETSDTHDSSGLSALLPVLRSRDALVGHFVTLDLGGKQVSGQAVGLDDRGHLVLRLADGEVLSFVSGHVLWQNREK